MIILWGWVFLMSEIPLSGRRGWGYLTFYNLNTSHPTPYTLHPTPYTLHPTPYTLHPTPYTLHFTPYTLHPAHPRHSSVALLLATNPTLLTLYSQP